MNFSRAMQIAQEMYEYLLPACDRLEIVGSLKRADSVDVHDIEFLMILNGKHPRPEFGRPKEVYKTMLDKILADLQYQDILKTPFNPADGDKLKRRAIANTGELNQFCVEMFIVTPKTWGIQNVIRTGPGLFSHRYVMNKGNFFVENDVRYEGFLPKKYTYIRGETIIKEGDKVLDLPEEIDAIELLGHGWIAPGKRKQFALQP